MFTDPIADLITRIRNAYMSRKETVTVPHSSTKMAILKVMKSRKFINNFKEKTEGKFKEIEIELNQEKRDITLKRVSKPGQRIYLKSTELKKVNGGLGVTIVSTSKGILSGEEAKKQKVGGEVMCKIY